MAFVVIEGIDGSGKSTLLRELGRRWPIGPAPLCLREPGSTALGETVRRTLLDPGVGELAAWTEVCLFTACRAELVRTVIRPALEAGRDVLLDRYLPSTVAYQGHAGGADPRLVTQLNLAATGDLLPDLVLLCDLEPGAALARLKETADRIEARGASYLAKVREGYLSQAREAPARWVVLDAAAPADELAARALARLCELPEIRARRDAGS